LHKRRLLARLLRWRARDHVVWLERGVEARLNRESDRHRPNETGGLLVGYRIGHATVVRALVGCGPRAVHARSSFHPDAAWQESELGSAFHASGGTLTYKGDWHSHPAGSGRPSSLDKQTARKIAEYREARLPRPLMIINVPNGTTWTARAYIYERGKLRRCEVRGFSSEA
jgi:integrative and conjugative element protein (TIGR02256 family)